MAPTTSTKLVSVVTSTGDKKLSHNGNMAATWVPQVSCHDDCSLKNNGCYAERGNAGFQTSRLNKAVSTFKGRLNALRQVLAKQEATLIDGLTAVKKLRVHVVGDCANAQSASIVGRAMVRYEQRLGQMAYTYTHSWRRFPLSAWKGARVMASCEKPSEVKMAWRMGYRGVSLLVKPHESNKTYQLGGVTVVPCPAQFYKNGATISTNPKGGTRLTTCEKCSICMNGDLLYERKMVVGFAPDHGTAKSVLPLIQA